MAMNSVNTNLGAMVALQSLNRTNSEMSLTQKAISTGLRVADAKDDGAAYAIAQRVRSDIGGLTSVNQQLSNTKGLLDTTLSSLDKVSTTMKDMKGILTSLASTNTAGTDRENYIAQYKQKLQSIKDFVKDASYNDRALISNQSTAVTPATQAERDAIGFGDIAVVRNEKGANLEVKSVDLGTFIEKLDFGADSNYTAQNMQAVLGGTTTTNTYGAAPPPAGSPAGTPNGGLSYNDAFKEVQTKIGITQNSFGTSSKYINDQISYNNDRIDAIKGGLGAMVDADLSKEAANLQALQVRQQLGAQALSIANQGPQSLLSLFR